MKLPLAYYGNPILRKKGGRVTEITDEIRQLVNDMIETMRENNGIGLAAPQVQLSKTLFITQVPIKVDNDPDHHEWVEGNVRVFINPKILGVSKEEWIAEEGCLSIPGLYGKITRPVAVRVQATDLDGNLFEEEFTWLDARVILHENDHINGVLYIDRMHGKDRQQIESKLNDIKKKYR